MTKRRSLDQQHSIVEAAHDYGIILDTREIFLSGEFDDNGDLGRSFLANIQILLSRSTTSPITIHQHSVGGDWGCGMIVFDAIANCKSPIIFVCHGIAASMGTIVPMACLLHGNSYRINMPNCDWLIHDGTTGINPALTHRQSQSWSRWENTMQKRMTDWYVMAIRTSESHAEKTNRQLSSYVKSKLKERGDWLLSAREAQEHGLVDAVLGDKGFESLDKIRGHW